MLNLYKPGRLLPSNKDCPGIKFLNDWCHQRTHQAKELTKLAAHPALNASHKIVIHLPYLESAELCHYDIIILYSQLYTVMCSGTYK